MPFISEMIETCIFWSYPFILVEVAVFLIAVFVPFGKRTRAFRKLLSVILPCLPFAFLAYSLFISLCVTTRELHYLIEPVIYIMMGFCLQVV